MTKEKIHLQPKSLLWAEGASAITQDQKGVWRYLYEDGCLDERSKVDPRTPHLELSADELQALHTQAETQGGTLKQKAGELALQREAEAQASSELTELEPPAIIAL